MALFRPRGLGWLPSAPDFRDYVPESDAATGWLNRMRQAGAPLGKRASNVDLREYFLGVDDQLDLNSSPAHACASLVQYFERRAHGRLLSPSRLFLYQNALRLAGKSGDCGVDLRAALKALVRCGAPPERYWPYETSRFESRPDAFLYSFTRLSAGLEYLRLDSRNRSGGANLQTVKSFLAAGFAVAFGFGVPNSLSTDGEILYRPTFDGLLGGQAAVAVGYDDRWLRGSRGALLIRSSWGADWGDAGYGWLPYAFVEESLAVDFWTLTHADWVASGEFDVPDLSA